MASSILLENESDIGALVELRNCLRKIEDRISTLTMQSKHCLPFLQSGRLVQFRLVDVGVVWGIVVKYGRSDKHSNKIDGNLCKVEIFYSTEDLLSSTTVLVDLADITKLSAIRLSLPNNLSRHGAALGVRNAMTEVVRRFGVVGIPLLDAVDDMKIPDSELVDLKQELVVLNGKLKNVEEKLIDVNDHSIEQYTKKATLIDQANILVKQATEFNSVSMTEELKNRKRVLKKLDFITDDEILCLKGKFSCELTTGDELVLTTLIFNGAFQDLSVAQTVALLSCFVHQEPTKAESLDRLRKEMQIPVQNLMHTAKSIGKICADAHVIPSEEDYVRSFNPGLVEATYQWSIGAKFSDVCKLTDTFEGNIIRVFRRLDELLRQLASASLAIGNGEMVKLFEDGSKSIRRGVVFAASLYL